MADVCSSMMTSVFIVKILLLTLTPTAVTSNVELIAVTKNSYYEPFHISSCKVQVFYEVKSSTRAHQAINEFTVQSYFPGVPLVIQNFVGLPFVSLWESVKDANEKEVTDQRFLCNCKIMFVYHYKPSNEFRSSLDLGAIENPFFLPPSNKAVQIDTENTYIVLVNEKDARIDLTQRIIGIRPKTFKSRMSSLRQKQFRFGVFHELNPHNFRINGKKYGTSYEFTEELSNTFNFTYTPSFIPLQVTELEDGTISGWENEIIYDRVDAEVFYVANYVYKSPILQFTTPIWKAEIVYVAKVPAGTTSWTTILGVLEPTTWAAFAGITIAFGLAAYAKVRVVSPICGEKVDAGGLVISLMYNALVSQASVYIPKSIRMLALLWLFCSIVMTNYYTSNLLSLLTTQNLDEKIPQSMSELEQRKDYDIFAMDHPGGPLEDYFNHTTTPHLINIWKRTKLLPLDICVLHAITTPKTVCMGWEFLFEAIVQANATISKLFNPAVTIDADLITVYHSVIMRKNVPYADAFNEAVGWFRDTGVYQAWLNQISSATKYFGRLWLTDPAQRGNEIYKLLNAAYKSSTKSEAEPLVLTFMIAPFVIIAVGLTISFAVLVAEVTWVKCGSRVEGETDIMLHSFK